MVLARTARCSWGINAVVVPELTVMQNIGRGIGTAALWGGMALAAHVFAKADVLSWVGAAWMTVGVLAITICIWLLGE